MSPAQPLLPDNSCLLLLMVGRALLEQLLGAMLEVARRLLIILSCLKRLSRSSGIHQVHWLCQAEGAEVLLSNHFGWSVWGFRFRDWGNPTSHNGGCTEVPHQACTPLRPCCASALPHAGICSDATAPGSTRAKQVWGAWHAASGS